MLLAWILYTTSAFFAAALGVALIMAIRALMRGGGATGSDSFMKPMHWMNVDYDRVKAIVLNHIEVQKQQRPKDRAAVGRVTGTGRGRGTRGPEASGEPKKSNNVSVNVVTDIQFDFYHGETYMPMVASLASILVASAYLLGYLCINYNVGAWTRSDAVTVNYVSWLTVAFNYAVLMFTMMYIAGVHRSASHGLLISFGGATLAGLVGVAFAAASLSVSNAQYVGLGAGWFYTLLLAGFGWVVFSKRRLAPFYLVPGSTVLNRHGFFIISLLRTVYAVTWFYFLIKSLWLLLSPAVTNVITDSNTIDILQMSVDIGFYIIITIMLYYICERVSKLVAGRVLERNGVALTNPTPYGSEYNVVDGDQSALRYY